MSSRGSLQEESRRAGDGRRERQSEEMEEGATSQGLQAKTRKRSSSAALGRTVSAHPCGLLTSRTVR